jgi:hypothetical protein
MKGTEVQFLLQYNKKEVRIGTLNSGKGEKLECCRTWCGSGTLLCWGPCRGPQSPNIWWPPCAKTRAGLLSGRGRVVAVTCVAFSDAQAHADARPMAGIQGVASVLALCARYTDLQIGGSCHAVRGGTSPLDSVNLASWGAPTNL